MNPQKISATICLNMIVKNESQVICETLNNLCSYINFSYWVICDTGSTDNTKELIKDFFKEKNIKGELVEHVWKDFGHNRSEALKSAYNKTDLIFIFDADDKIVGNLVLPNIYHCDKYLFKFGNDFVYTRPLLFNNRKRWRFEGVLHEYLTNIDEVFGESTIEGDYYLISGKTGHRSQNPNKYIEDAKILKKAHYDELEKNYALSCRYAFYCAQSYKDSGPKYIDNSIKWYKKCLDFNMWQQEKFYSSFTIGDLYMLKNDPENALKYWYKSIEYDPERIEGIVNAANYLRNNGQNLLVNALYHKFKNYNKKLQNKLFLLQYLYDDLLEYNSSISSYYVHDKEIGYDCCKKIIINNILKYDFLKLTINNFIFYIDLLENDNDTIQLFYSFDTLLNKFSNENEVIDENMITIWNILFNKNKKLLTKFYNYKFENRNSPQILLTFTTCKRFDLFKQTINSILNHWLDIDKIDYWFCVDDNSTETDRNTMKLSYPWIDYYMKTIQEKGHRQSMNIIWNKLNELKPIYWIHMEDDFLFHSKMNYIGEAIKAINSELCKSNNVKQILFNRNYGEIIEHYNTKGHIINENCINIALHKYVNGTFNYQNCHYWPHYSFRPSLIDVKTILEIGNYDTENTFFEIDYAKKWSELGYTSAFFNKITNRHIGRLTNDRNIKNAYELNNENQFNKEESKKDNIVLHIEDIDISNNVIFKIINLERRQDRKEETIKKLTDAGINKDQYEFINAVDGQKLEPTQEIFDLFKENDFGNRKGVIGCALSHYNLWKQLLTDKNNEYYLIMEDDFTLCSNFKTKIELLKNEFISKECLFLGYHMFEDNRKIVKDIYDNDLLETIKVTPLNKNLYIGGTFLYSINKNGAKKMVEYIQNKGIRHGIDYVIKNVDNLDCYESHPLLVFSEWNEGNKEIDSDIQNTYDGLDFSKFIKNDGMNNIYINEKFIFLKNLDFFDNDIFFINESVPVLMDYAENNTNYIGFNTLGFFKNKIDIDDLKKSPYFGENDGIYIKKEYYDKYLENKQKLISETNNVNYNNVNSNIRLKMICNWCSSEQLCKEWSNMCEEDFRWKNFQLVWSNKREDIDYYVIINFPNENEYFDPSKTIVFQMEPWVYDMNKNWGVKTWGNWAEPDPSKFLEVRGRKTPYHNNAFWQLELTYHQLLNLKVEKTKIISSICSSKYFDEGHIARIDLLKYIEEKNDPNIIIDIYNQDNTHKFKNFRGPVTPYIDKSNGLLPYKYYFMIENNYEENFITEKLWEPILCETLCFYYGCPNVTDYIDSRAFVLLDINDFEKSYQIIKKAIEQDLWSQRIDIIRKEKQKILNEMSFFPIIEKIINKNILENGLIDNQHYNELYEKYFEEFNNKNYGKLINFLNNYNSSAWLGHIKFAMWLVNKYKPKITVELGVDYGHSSFAFSSEGIGEVYGIDCFEGDIHAGQRNTFNILNDTKKYLLDNKLLVKDNFYPIKGFFDDIYETFNYEIDILHIDGLHTYNDVSNDFNKWINKTHDNSIILMHDVISFKDTVGKFFDEIQYPKTYFEHSAGLGIVSKNQSIIDNIIKVWMNDNPKKYCFIHSCHLKEIGIDILNDIINNIINSNLIQYLEKIFIINIGENLSENMFMHEKIIIINYSDNHYLFEMPTINLIRTFCEYNDNCEILYLHTKGISYYDNKYLTDCIADWKNMMLYFLVNKYANCFDLLKKYDVIGCNYTQQPFNHFSGNFWWATSNYIKNLKILPNNCTRHEAEWWILSTKFVKSYEIHNSLTNHYHFLYPKDKYVN